MPQQLYDAAQVETPEQIELELPLAGVGSRSIAYLLDLLCQIIPVVATLVLAFLLVPLGDSQVVGKDANGLPELEVLPMALVSLCLFAVNFGYFALFEIFWRGQSPGKRWLGLRVVKDGGFPLDGRAALVRNLLRVVDFLPAFYVVGMSSLFLSGRGKRVGDYAAGTIVVRERRVSRERPEVARGAANDPGAEARTRPAVALSPEDGALLDGFLDRREALDPAARRRLAEQLASRFAGQLGKPAPADAELFLESLAG